MSGAVLEYGIRDSIGGGFAKRVGRGGQPLFHRLLDAIGDRISKAALALCASGLGRRFFASALCVAASSVECGSGVTRGLLATCGSVLDVLLIAHQAERRLCVTGRLLVAAIEEAPEATLALLAR